MMPENGRCIFLFIDSLPDHGGAEKQITMLALQLKKRGYEVLLFLRCAPHGGKPNPFYRLLTDAGIKVVSPGYLMKLKWLNLRQVGLFGLLPLRLLMALLDAWWKKRPFSRSWVGVRGRLNRLLPDAGLLELILVGHLVFYKLLKRPILFHVQRFDGGRGILWASRLRLPIVYTEQAAPTGEYRRWWDQLKPFINRAALVIAVCQASGEGIRQYCGFQGEIRVIPQMVECPKPSPSRLPKSGNTVVGFAGRLAKEKGLEFLLRAASQVLDRCSDVHFLIAGDGECKDDLLQLAKSLGMAAQVEFMGRYDADQLGTFMSKIDIFVLPSLTEALPVTLIEAMAYAKPIVATEVGGVPEVVQDGISGRLVRPRDPAALANAILSLVHSPEERYRLGTMGRRLYECRYTPPMVLEQILAAYQSVLRWSG